jgi:ABC-type multidrug transport system permease subunit
MELITEPKILFLDEPTSGLDAYTAHSITKLLVDYAHNGHTVVATLHQPSTDIFNLFDDLLLLNDGKVIYYGAANEVLDYFEKWGYEFPKYSNPADFIFMHVLRERETDEMVSRWGESEMNDKMRRLIEESQETETNQDEIFFKKFKSSFRTQFKYLTTRATKNAIRNEFIIRVRLFQSIFIGVLAGLVFINSTHGTVAAQIQSLSGVLYFLSVNQFFGSATAVLSIFSQEKMVFLREYRAGYYGLSAYYFSKVLVELPYQIIFPALLLLIAYYIIGLNPTFSAYLLASSLLIFCAITGSAIGTFISAIFDDVAMALAVLPLFLLPVLLFSGLFVNSGNFPVWLSWLQYGSPVRYSFSGLLQNQFNSYTFNNCDTRTQDCSGQLALIQLGFGNDLPPGILIAILSAIYVIFVTAGYLALLYKIKNH